MNLKTRNDKRTTKKKKQDFLDNLEIYGNVSLSCKKAKVSRMTIYNWKEQDPKFNNDYEISAKLGVEALEDEARRRAFEGTTKPVYQGGKKVGSVKEYSDTLLIFLLNGAKPEVYKNRHEFSGKVGFVHEIDYSKLSNAALEEIAAAGKSIGDGGTD